MKKLLCLFLVFAALIGCSSNNDVQRQLELMASNRAGVLSAGLPLKYGPLQIMRVSSNKNVVEMMMIYNDGALGAKPLDQVLNTSIYTYCSAPEIRKQIDMGLMYRIKVRNSRGQLMADELVSGQTCAQLK
ncbi:type II secretion system (T2SS) pilotin (S protein) [Vibrio sp. ES.051]|uniref:GspS/AspS pilotin family protein n=1 Tax=Vibrio sp. ES.051 TaxID=1761909 RepID=UPI000BF74415|nr:GspS/AspS pilotin family protein [Vibrio sp. ES.051]PFG45791.1 type II secretion system (T2SS) pilotin (S protein) [Vibrio sp. ES.051]